MRIKIIFTLFAFFLSKLIFAQAVVKTDTIYYDIKWKVTKNVTNAGFYRVLKTDKNGTPVGITKDYYITGEVQRECKILTHNPETKDGYCTWYYKDGSIYSIDYFVKNRDFAKIIKQNKLYNIKTKSDELIKYYNTNAGVNLENSSKTAYVFSSVSAYFMHFRKYDKAIFFYQISANLFKEHKNLIAYAKVLNSIGIAYYSKSDIKNAEKYYLACKNIRAKTLGKQHPDYASSLNNLALLYKTEGDYKKSVPFYVEAISIYKINNNKKDNSYITIVNNLANIYLSMGKYQQAELLYIEAIKTRKEILGDKHIDYGVSLNSLGTLYVKMGKNKEAEVLFVDVTKIFKEKLGEQHPDYATALNNLAFLYESIGNYEKAEPLYVSALNIRKKALGNKHSSYAESLNNLATLYYNSGNYVKAKPLFIEALKAFKTTIGTKHPTYATSLNNLAALCDDLGDFKSAEKFYIDALNNRKATLGTKHPAYASALSNLAVTYFKMGKSETNKKKASDYFEKAKSLYLEAIKINKEVLGDKHPNYAIPTMNLADLYLAMGNLSYSPKIKSEYSQKAMTLYIENIKITNFNINQNFSFLSEKEKELYYKTESYKFNSFYSLSLKQKYENPAMLNYVYDIALKNKGLLLKSSTAMRNAILSSENTDLITTYDNWISIKKEISKLYSTAIDKRTQNPKMLEEQANELEKELVKASQIFSDFEKIQNIKWQNVQQKLNPNEVAIEFIHFKYYDKEWTDKTYYCALIIKANSKHPEMIKLFEEKELETIIGKFGGNNFSYINRIYGKNSKNNNELYKLIWKPMEGSLSGIKTIYISPSGLLHKVSFAAIGDKNNSYLCDKYTINLQSTTAKVTMPENFLFNKKMTATIFGGIDYNTDSTTQKIWSYLEATKSESKKIEQILKTEITKVNYYSSRSATEEKFKTLASNSNLVHIATHGFFFPDPNEKENEEKEKIVEKGAITFRGGSRGFGVESFVKNENPLMRSGLVFAGGNDVWSRQEKGEGEDGVLSAQEVAHIDLRKTNLVVMSACETGLGDIKGSEGVYGLQRAFKMAGVNFLIMSLWQVPDKETEEFMTTFYSKFLSLKNIKQAFTQTQKEMRQKYDPYFWAAFVLVE